MTASVARAADWRSLELGAGGRSLIEASAGTGKTWTIAALYLRLVLEGQTPLTPRQIVVTTFTDAAAQELRERVRARLLDAEAFALAHLHSPRPDAATLPDELHAWLWQRWHDACGSAATDLMRLRLALAELDLAPIATLHGLCRRILADFPFDSGSGFRAPALIDGADLLDELSDDLWRRIQQSDEAKYAGTLQRLRETLQQALAPAVELWAPDATTFERTLPADAESQVQALIDPPALYEGKKAALKNALQSLAQWLRDPQHEISETHSKSLLRWDVDDQVREAQREAMRTHPVRSIAKSALRLAGYAHERERITALQGWCAQARIWREARLAARDQQTFDSLIECVAQAVAQPTLAAALCAAWPVALVDEFQDTDAQQYAILDGIYRYPDGSKRGRLVLIGDPKQAIYGFRGGDVQTYLRAVAEADATLHLLTNRRSTRAYVSALNELYEGDRARLSSRPQHAIGYEVVQADGRRDEKPYCAATGAVHTRPLQLHYCVEVPAAAAQRRELALQACAHHIAGLLNAGERIDGRALQPGDIAVLLPTHRDVTRLRDLLHLCDVPCVTAAPGSVFDGDYARELHLVLYALAHGADHGALRAALATSLGGWSFADLAQPADNSTRWTAALQHYEDLRLQWRQEGVLAVVLALAREAAKRRAMPAERERLLTDLRHLGELLQAQSQQLEGEAQLLAWFALQRRGEGADVDATEERRLRLESDARRVRLSTLHASKGLEFNLVFLPLMWSHVARKRQTDPLLREPLCGGKRVLGFGPVAKLDAMWDEQDERHRVLYVALTRARYACHVYALPPLRPSAANSKKPAADPERSALDGLVERLLSAAPIGGTPADIAPHIAWQDGWAWPAVRYIAAVADSTRALRARAEPARAPFVSSYSFSSLVARQSPSHTDDDAAADEARVPTAAVEPEDADANAASEQVAPPHATLLALAELRGTEFGNAVHAVFERRVIGEPLAHQRGMIERCLREFAVRGDALPRDVAIDLVAERVEAALAAEILPGLRLRDVPAARQRAEMAFHFVLQGASLDALRSACVRHGADEIVPLQLGHGTLRGLMSGKIDLVFEHRGRFHVLDYKSNWLGDRVAAYSGPALDFAMDAHAYRLQALLYSVAVQRYLRQRLPQYRADAHLGAAIYLFVRAAQLAPGAGIWRQRFDPGLLDAVDRALGGAWRPEAA